MTHCRSWTCQYDSIPFRRHIVSPSQTTGRFVKKTPPEKVPHVDLSPLSFLSLIIDGSKEFQGLRELPGAAFFLFSPHLCSSLHRAWRKVSAFFSFCFSHPTTQEIKMSVVSGEAFRQSGHFTFHTHYFAVYSLLSAQLQHLGNDPPPSIPTPTMSDYPCFNDCPVPSEDKWRNGADYSPTPRLHSRLDKWTFAIRKIGLCSPGLFIYSRGKESSWSSWHRGWAPSAQESACALYSSRHIKLFLQAASTSEVPQLSLLTLTEIGGYFWNLSFIKIIIILESFPKTWLLYVRMYVCMYVCTYFLNWLINSLFV